MRGYPQPVTGRCAAVDVRGLNKTFRIPRQHVMTLKERALHPFRRTEVDELEALRDVSFQVGEGEFFGIVGRNGSGKSTLLKCLAGIYRADSGSLRVAGRLSPFIELGVGFNPDLTAYDNVRINGVMMGLTPGPRPRALRRDPGLRRAGALQGPQAQELLVGHAGAAGVLGDGRSPQADVYLIDEVLAVGDAAFQRKCFDVFDRLRAEGRTIVLVTHDMAMIERFADRAMALRGRRASTWSATPDDVAERYFRLNFEEHGAAARDRPGGRGRGDVDRGRGRPAGRGRWRTASASRSTRASRCASASRRPS